MHRPLALVMGALLGGACASPAPRRSSPAPPPVAAADASTTSESPAPAPPASTSDSAPRPPPWTIRPIDRQRIDALVEHAIRDGDCPGAVVVITRDGVVLHRRAYGSLSVEPDRVPMTEDAVFDLASLTKPIVTTTAIMQLVERGALSLDTPVADHLPAFAGTGKDAITVEQLLGHTSGLPAVNPLSDYRHGRDDAIARALARTPLREPGRRVYSDLGYIVLGELVARVSGQPLDAYAREHIFEPLGMSATFHPEGDLTIVPTTRRGRHLRGEAHDLRAAGLGGVAGHAGLFADADDVTRFATMLAGEGLGAGGRRVLAPSTVRGFQRPIAENDPRYGLGYSRFADGLSHTGFTGTYLYAKPDAGVTVVLLTSRLHPDEKGDVTELRQNLRFAGLQAAMEAERRPAVRPGIDVLGARGLDLLRGKRVGLITNHTGRSIAGTRTADVIHRASDVELVAIFSPEHGLGGTADEAVGDQVDEDTGRLVYSLYGERQRPSRDQLRGIDTLVFDIQDVGARFYTYVTTLGLALEAATESGLGVVVLDRPNPLGGQLVEGPVLDEDRRSFIAYHPIPIRHGMTVGELALLFAADKQLVTPTVVKMEGWHRAMTWSSTGLPWRPPSPNLPRPEAARLYPGLALVEATNVSVGRGTAHPFEVVGAPWIDAEALTASLRAADLDGLFVEPTSFTPERSRHAGRLCHGVALTVDDPARFRPLRLGVALALALREHHRAAWQSKGLLTLLGDAESHRAILAGEPLDGIVVRWAEELARFHARRARHLLYD